jgi:hypothetical protein
MPPSELLGEKPITYHEFVIVPKSPKSVYEQLSEEQRRANAEWAGRWVRD